MPVSIKRKNSSKPKTMSKYKSSSNSKKHLIKSSKYGSKSRKMSGGSFSKLFRGKSSNSGSVKSRSGSSGSNSSSGSGKSRSDSVKSRSGSNVSSGRSRYSMSRPKSFVIELPLNYRVTYGKDTRIVPGPLSSNPSLLVPPEIINVLQRKYPDTHQPLKRPTSVINNSFQYGPHAELINKFYSKETHDKGEDLYKIEFEKNYGYYRTDTERRQAAEKARSEYLEPIIKSLIALGYKIIPKY